MGLTPADRLALGAVEASLQQARDGLDPRRQALEVLAGPLAELGVRSVLSGTRRLVSRDLRAWLRRLESAGRSQSTIDVYRIAVGSLLAWAEATRRTAELFEEGAIVDYLDD